MDDISTGTQVSRLASWWSLSGWLQKPPPAAYAAINWDAGADARTLMEDAGYQRTTSPWRYREMAEAIYESEIVIWRHADPKHLLVELWYAEEQATEFFVDGPDISAFHVEKLPALAQSAAAVAQADAQRIIYRALIAFVRHGSGEHVISDDGFRTLDEERFEREAARARKQQREHAKATSGNPGKET